MAQPAIRVEAPWVPPIRGYRIARAVAHGGFGTVYEAFRAGQRVAIKVANTTDTDAMQMARCEVDALQRVGPPVVPTLWGHGTIDGKPYMVMEWIPEPSLATRIMDIGGPMSIAEFGMLAPHMLRAVAGLHAHGIVHRDLKPEHIALDWRGGALQVRLLDLGLAMKFSADRRPMRPSSVLGTSGYMAPEQVERAPITVKADIYALGVIMYEMLSGDLPFNGTSSEQLLAHVNTRPPPVTTLLDLPARIERVIHRCLHKDPDARYASVTTLRHALSRALRAAGALAA